MANITGKESFFVTDEYLIPAVEDDPLLREFNIEHRTLPVY